ncbi:MAG: sigma-54 dependent transcriptional regulator [Bacteroidia bacterium]|nr:sigma-54 dependent transcriptional regulator [Bacteroidia bacterium]
MKILIVDDERKIRESLKDILDFEGHTSSEAADGKEGLEAALTGNFDAIFCDIKMPVMDGQEMLSKLVENGIDTPVIMISGHGSIEDAVKCIKLGAFDYIEKPLNDLNRILITLKNATEKTSLVKETKILRKKVEKVAGVPEIVGESEPIVRIKSMIDRVAATDARVLVTGSNGTGKELVARWLHEKSNRKSMPFVEVNCAAIPGELIESELFGHVKGSFSGAIKDHKGKFEQADGGTLFLDEIGDMSLSAQAKVLRVLQENKITRVGSDKDISVKVRVVAATNKNLLEEIAKGNFREDLYHRLSVIVIHVPALAERKEDIPLLVNHFINLICAESGMPPRAIEADAIEELKKHSWTGNIRELRNVTERLIILSNQTITKDDVVMYASPLFR